MPSEQHLHPFSMLFAFGGILKQFALPGLLVLIAGRSASGPGGMAEWDVWMMLLLFPAAIHAVVRYLTYRIRYESEELIIRSGLVFRNERHVPYARIQNLEAVRNVVHRLLGVVEVRVENASGREPEATISVLPDSAFDEMRRRVFAGRSREATTVPGPAAPAAQAAAEAGVPLLRLSPRQLMLAGFIENRGLVLVATIYGFFWQLGTIGDFWSRLLEGSAGNAGVRETLRSLPSVEGTSVRIVAAIVAGLLGLLMLVRVISMVWALVRLHNFTLTLAGNDLRMEFGLLTRVATTTPRRRIQTLTIRHTPLHRLFGQASIRIETAGGRPAADGGRGIEREWIAPIIAEADVPEFLRSVLPELTLDTLDWQPVHPRAFRRAVKPAIILAIATAAAAAGLLGRFAIALVPFTVAWFVVAAKKRVDGLKWSLDDDVVALRSGWLTRVTTAARVAKVQAVDWCESPFDRRTAMARVRVDTAGAGGHRIDVPYLPREVAVSLHRRLAGRAAATDFRW